MKFSNLSFNLPAAVATLSFAIAALMAIYSYYNARTSLAHEAKGRIELALDANASQLQAWLSNIEADLLIQAQNPTVIEAISRFSSGWDSLGNTAQQHLTDSYVTANPFPVGERHMFDTADDGSNYSVTHANLHPFFRSLMEKGDYYDVFLFDSKGNLIYSVYKEADFATNLATGPWKASGLGTAFRSAVSADTDTPVFVDFEPYAPSNDVPASFIATKVVGKNGEIVGVLAMQMPIDRLNGIFSNSVGIGKTGDIRLVGQDGLSRSKPRFDEASDILKPVAQTPQLEAALAKEEGIIIDTVNGDGTSVLAAYRGVNFLGTYWAIIAEQDTSELFASSNDLLYAVLWEMLIVAIASIGFGYGTARYITDPLNRLSNVMVKISQSEFDAEIKDINRKDELGTIARTLSTFNDQIKQADILQKEQQRTHQDQKRMIDELGDGLSGLANGDLTRTIDQPFSSEYEGLRENFNSAIHQMHDTIGQLIDAASAVGGGAHEINQASDDLSRRTENQAATLEQTAAALDELTSSVQSSAKGATEADAVVQQARTNAETSGEVVIQAVNAMTEIENSSDQISQIIGVIDDIAFQTNLLALNAGVEAARAGEAGRGFAVVASEVRALAQRSSEAAREIKALISTSSQQVEHGVGLVGKAGDALAEILKSVAHISTLVGDISASSKEQSVGLSEINTGVMQLDQVTQQNAAMVEEATAASHSLKTEAESLGQLVSVFRIAGSRPTAEVIPMRSPQPEPSIPEDIGFQTKRAVGSDHQSTGWEDF